MFDKEDWGAVSVPVSPKDVQWGCCQEWQGWTQMQDMGVNSN